MIGIFARMKAAYIKYRAQRLKPPRSEQQFPGEWDPRFCAFCGSGGKISDEHYWPIWLRKYVPLSSARTVHIVTRRTMRAGRRQEISGKGPLHRHGDPGSQSLSVACEQCNNVRMSQLQERAKPAVLPLIQDDWPNLTEFERRSIGAWATMFTMVYEFADIGTLITTPQEREQLRLTRDPPAHWVIWAGRYKGKKRWQR